MDHDIFRKTYDEVNERFCAYEKSILSRNCNCSRARRFCISEREGVHCNSDAAQAQCLQLLELLRAQARFALKSQETRRTITHGKAMKVQMGGLRGLKAVLEPEQPVPDVIDDVHGTIEAVRARFGSLEQVPLQPVIQQIAAYQGRPRSRGRHKR